MVEMNKDTPDTQSETNEELNIFLVFELIFSRWKVLLISTLGLTMLCIILYSFLYV